MLPLLLNFKSVIISSSTPLSLLPPNQLLPLFFLMMASHHMKLLFGLSCYILLVASLVSGQCNFPAIFNLGDSNSDTGGLSAALDPVGPPNGETYFHGPMGRYSDGRLVIDFIAKSLGLPYLSAYLDSLGTNFSHGANFATAASTIRSQNTSYSVGGWSPFSLDVQSLQLSEFKSRSQRVRNRGGVYKSLLPVEDYFSRALYTFDIGQNDLTQGYFLNMSTEEVKAYVPDLISKFTIAIKSVYEQGGRYFWIHNTAPFGCLPYVLTRVPVTQFDWAGCGIPFNEVAELFNKKLMEAVAELRKDLPMAAFTYVDIYSVKYKLISQARNYGFEHPLVACCGYGGKYNYSQGAFCGSKVVINGTQVLIKPCKNPLKRISWDGIHFTEAANKWVFDQISQGAYSDPPVSLQMACHRQA